MVWVTQFPNLFEVQCLSLAVGMVMTLVVNTLGATALHHLVLALLGVLGLAVVMICHLVAKRIVVGSMCFTFGLPFLISLSATASHPRSTTSNAGDAWESSSDASDTVSEGDGRIDLTHERVVSLQKNPEEWTLSMPTKVVLWEGSRLPLKVLFAPVDVLCRWKSWFVYA